ncbi:hypothetical protein [Capillimicrobium parvum]|uniref:Uncharacterized protein n=1 Tax=Capillimicrobium parvum TaxID=2884022 RepID=A0A9E7BZW3_9ACTN|nr:hypothetical protein [Capillimicrobium parvum]UGS34994.1 hypothetical protein DSM104329_01378 [Capillimicrobium parvum]
MGRAAGSPEQGRPAPRTARVAYVDAEGRETQDPAAAVQGEIVEYDGDGRPRGRTRFFLAERQIRWLPISESAFLIWVLAALIGVWLVIGVVLKLT